MHSGRSSVMVWGAISGDWTSALVRVRPTLKQIARKKGYSIATVDYINQVLAPVFEPGYRVLKEQGKKPIGMEDNAAIHTSTEAKLWHRTYQMEMMVWPPSSPDLNPDENMWRAMKQKIKRYPQVITKQEDLWQAAQKEWDRLVREKYHLKCIETLPTRMEDVIKNRGFATRW